VSFAEYAAHGWRLCSIERGHKSPLYAKWQTPRKADEVSAAAAGLDGAGLLHALSGTCALDIDSLTSARPWLAARGIDVQALLDAPEAVKIVSGRPDRAKLLYRLRKPLRTIKPPGSGLELRCATADGASVQDVLPPTVHPDTGKPYEWAYGEPLLGHWSELPPLPAALLTLWRELTPAPSLTPTAPSPGVDLSELETMLRGKNPDCSYDAWIRVGMAVHHATHGSADGLALWDQWSARAPGKYKGTDDLRTHWLSFNSGPGKRVVTAASLQADTPASRDEFEDIEPEAEGAEPDPDSSAAKLVEAAELKRKEAIEWLENRLVFVRAQGAYFDCEEHHLIPSLMALEHEFTPYMPRVKGGRMNPLKVLKESRTRQVVSGVGFHPGKGPIFESESGDRFANLYRNRLPEPIEPTAGDRDRIEWLFDRIDDADYRDWFKQFYGYVVQHPGHKIMSAPLIWSKTTGNGKTTLLDVIPEMLVGKEYSAEVNSSLLNSDFNDYLLNAWHVNLVEFRADSKGERRAISAKLRAWITDSEIALNPKGKTAYKIPNHFFLTATSNEEDAASIDNNDRRWAIHELMAPPFSPSEQRWIHDEFLKTKRAAAVLRHYFLNVDTSTFNPAAPAIHTAARKAMIRASMSADLEYLLRAFEERSGPFAQDVVRSSDVAEAIRRETRLAVSPERIGRLLIGEPFKAHSRKAKVNKGTVNFLVLANHDKWSCASGAELMEESLGQSIDILA